MKRLIHFSLLCFIVSNGICSMEPVEEFGEARSIKAEEVIAEQQQAIDILVIAMQQYKTAVQKGEFPSSELKASYLNRYVELVATLEESIFALLIHRKKLPEKTVQLLIANKSTVDQFKSELAALSGPQDLVDMQKLTEIESLLEEAFLNGKIFISSRKQNDPKAAAEHAVYMIKTCAKIKEMPYFKAMTSGKLNFMGSDLLKKSHDLVWDRFVTVLEAIKQIDDCMRVNKEVGPKVTVGQTFDPVFAQLKKIKQTIRKMEATPGPYSADEIREQEDCKKLLLTDLEKCEARFFELETPLLNTPFKTEQSRNEYLGRFYKIKAKISKLKKMILVQQVDAEDTPRDNLLREQRIAAAQLESVQIALSVYTTGDPDCMEEGYQHLQRVGKEFLKNAYVQKVLASNDMWSRQNQNSVHQSILETTMAVNDIMRKNNSNKGVE